MQVVSEKLQTLQISKMSEHLQIKVETTHKQKYQIKKNQKRFHNFKSQRMKVKSL